MGERRLFLLLWAVILGGCGIAVATLGRYGLNVVAFGLLYGALATGWSWLRATGLFSFGHAAFFGVGALTQAWLVSTERGSPWLALVASASAGALAALGAVVEPADPGFPSPRELFERTWFPGAALVIDGIAPERRKLVDPGLLRIAEQGARLGALDLQRAAKERAELARSARHRHLVAELPPGAHGRPEGAGESTSVLGVWTYDVEPVEPTFPPGFDSAHPEVVLRGMARMIPAMAPYVERLPRCFMDGGYYTKTRENRLLSGPLPIQGAYVIGALSGYGMMSSNGAADLLADYIAERPLPRYAPAFHLNRYDDPAYQKLLDNWGDSGQL